MSEVDEGEGLLLKDRIQRCGMRGGSYRWRQNMYALFLGLGNGADAAEVVCLGFIMADMDDELSQNEKGLLSSAVFMGMLVGGLFWGSLSDILGRKYMYQWSLAISSLGDLTSVVAPNITFLILSRVVAGLGIGGSVPTLYALGKEIFATKRRYLHFHSYSSQLAFNPPPKPPSLIIVTLLSFQWRVAVSGEFLLDDGCIICGVPGLALTRSHGSWLEIIRSGLFLPFSVGVGVCRLGPTGVPAVAHDGILTW